MNTEQEYKEYEQAVSNFFKTEGINNLSAIADGDGDVLEPSFSGHSCDCCGTTLGGDRYAANGYNPATKEVQEYDSICSDCIYYAGYGQLDD